MEDDGLHAWRGLGASQRLRDRLMSSQLLTHQGQWQREITTLPWHNRTHELDDPDSSTFKGTPVIRPPDPLSSTLPGIDADRFAILAQRRRQFISERDGVE